MHVVYRNRKYVEKFREIPLRIIYHLDIVNLKSSHLLFHLLIFQNWKNVTATIQTKAFLSRNATSTMCAVIMWIAKYNVSIWCAGQFCTFNASLIPYLTSIKLLFFMNSSQWSINCQTTSAVIIKPWNDISKYSNYHVIRLALQKWMKSILVKNVLLVLTARFLI